MSNVGYILDVWYKDRLLKAFIEVNSKWKSRMMIEIRIDELLEKRERSFYWLSKQSGISHTTLWRLKKGKALGINFATLEKICEILDCEPGDLLKFSKAEKKEVTESSK
jgi:putative transcriptional regulator